MDRKPDLCALCGIRSATTRNHVPGKWVFPQPRPNDLITVPACSACNNGLSKDEEFFRATYLFSDAGVGTTGQRLWNQKQHTAYSKNSGLRRAIAQRLRPVQVFTPRGLWAGERISVELDHARLSRVVCSIIRGLFWFETGTILGTETCLEVAPLLSRSAIGEVEPLAKDLYVGKRDWPGVFEYRPGISVDVHQGSIWFVRFFGKVCYWAISSPSKMLPMETGESTRRRSLQSIHRTIG